MAQDDAIARLARQIDAARKAERFLVDPSEVAGVRRQGACELHRICAEFVSSVNGRLGGRRWTFRLPRTRRRCFGKAA